MKRKPIITPFSELTIALLLFLILAYSVRSCINRFDKDQAQLNEMLEYHSKPDQLTTNCEGYIRITNQ